MSLCSCKMIIDCLDAGVHDFGWLLGARRTGVSPDVLTFDDFVVLGKKQKAITATQTFAMMLRQVRPRIRY